MFSYGETIGGYRVISRFSSDDTSSSYFVEPSQGKGLLVIRVWEQIQLVDVDARDAFLAEAASVAWLRHPSISPVFDYGIEKGRPYVVVEHYDPPLVRLTELLEQISLTQEQALTVFTEVREALDYAHQEGVTHGHLSPEYVLLDADDKVVLEFPLSPLSKISFQNGRSREGQLSDQHALVGLAQGLFNGHPLPEAIRHQEATSHPQGASLHKDDSDPLNVETSLAGVWPGPEVSGVDEGSEDGEGDEGSEVAEEMEEDQGSIEKTEVLAAIAVEEELMSIEKNDLAAPTVEEEPVSLEKEEVLAATTAEEDPMPVQKSPSPVPVTSSGQVEQTGQKKVRRPRAFQLASLAVAALLLLGLAIPLLIRYVPASSARITITPATKHLKNLYTIRGVPGAADASRHEIQVRHLKATSNASASVTASGQGNEEPAVATGKVVLSNMSQAIENVESLTLTTGGVSIIIELTQPGASSPVNLRPGETYELNASTRLTGSFGNVPAHFFDGDHFFFATNVPGTNFFNFTAHIENPAAFSGGKNGGSYVFLQKQDIDTVALPLINGLKDSTSKEVQQQIQPDEQTFVANSLAEGVSCSVNQQGNKINDRVSGGTITIEVTCEAAVYNPQQAMQAASAWQKEEATRQLGAQYQLAGDMRTTLDKSQILIFGDVLHIPIATEGYWVYQFQADQLRELAQSISGKAQDEALTLLKNRPGIATSKIATSSILGTALPWSMDKIEFTMTQVTGLRTTE